MAYTKYNDPWANGSGGGTPIVAAALDHIETGIFDAAATADAAIADVSHVSNGPLYWNGSAWVSDTLKNAQIAADASIAVSKLAPGSAGNVLATSAGTAQWLDPQNLIGAVSTYTPTWMGASSNPAIGNGTLTGRYIQIGKLVHVFIGMTAGSTTTFGSGAWFLSLPVADSTGAIHHGSGFANDSSSAFYGLLVRQESGSQKVSALNQATRAFLASNVPFAWGSGDILNLSLTYEAA